MNYLAHAYLSFHHPGILVGNMISDFVKGNRQYDYPSPIQAGIRLHRLIDEYTDTHAATREAKKLLQPYAGRYAGAFTDIIYDHFLALDNSVHTAEEWKALSASVYAQLNRSVSYLPERFAAMLPHMEQFDWLYNYRLEQGIANSFKGLVRRAKYASDWERPFEGFRENYRELRQCYAELFPGVRSLAYLYVNERPME